MKRKNKTQKKSIPLLKFFVVCGSIAFISFVVVDKSMEVLRNSPKFIIRGIYIDPSLQFIKSYQLTSLIGKSIFAVNLNALERKLTSQYPELSDLKIVRKFPDKILILAQKRVAVAQTLINGSLITLDQEGVVLSQMNDINQNLPLIVGIRFNSRIAVGWMMRGADVNAALDIIKSFRENTQLFSFKITNIDVQNLSKIYLTVSENLKIIIDRYNIPHKIRLLGLILSQQNLDWTSIKYIDLRFKEPIVGKK